MDYDCAWIRSENGHFQNWPKTSDNLWQSLTEPLSALICSEGVFTGDDRGSNGELGQKRFIYATPMTLYRLSYTTSTKVVVVTPISFDCHLMGIDHWSIDPRMQIKLDTKSPYIHPSTNIDHSASSELWSLSWEKLFWRLKQAESLDGCMETIDRYWCRNRFSASLDFTIIQLEWYDVSIGHR